MIYFIECNDFIKIGKSNNPEQRLQSLQVASPYKLNLLKVLDVDDVFEKDVHKYFSYLHHRGEWFKKDALLMHYIESDHKNDFVVLEDWQNMDTVDGDELYKNIWYACNDLLWSGKSYDWIVENSDYPKWIVSLSTEHYGSFLGMTHSVLSG